MTVIEVIKSHPGLADVPDVQINRILIDRDVNGADLYVKELSVKTDLCIADLLRSALSQPDLTESDLTIKRDRPGMYREMVRIYTENGETDKIPSYNINDASDKW